MKQKINLEISVVDYSESFVQIQLHEVESGKVLSERTLSKDALTDDSLKQWAIATVIAPFYKEITAYNSKYAINQLYINAYKREALYIDGEDASEFILRCQATMLTSNFQSQVGLSEGWKYYKVLRKHNFKPSVAAMLAYTRGFLSGMEWNNRWEAEGTEALYCLGLTTLDGRTL